MKEKGISFTAGLVVVVLVVLAGVGYFFLTRGAKEGLPVYPEATVFEVPELWSELFVTFESHGISASVYTTEAGSDEVLDWYRSEMSERGWTKILDNIFDNFHILSFQKGNEGAGVMENKGILILVHSTMEQFQAVVEEWYQQLHPAPGPPALTAHPTVDENTIRINVVAGSIPAGDWQYSVSSAPWSYSWTDGTEALDVPYVSLGTYATGTWYVSLRHKVSGHIYFANRLVTISGEVMPGVYAYVGVFSGIENQKYVSVWENVKDFEKTKFVTAENSYSVLVFMHPYTVGMFDSSTAEWIIIVSSIPETSNEVKVAIVRLDYQTFHLKKAYEFSYVVQIGLTLDDVITTMEEKIVEVEGGAREISSHEVELLGGDYVYSYPAIDFGGTIIVNKYVGKPIFYATTVWAGVGHLKIPEP